MKTHSFYKILIIFLISLVAFSCRSTDATTGPEVKDDDTSSSETQTAWDEPWISEEEIAAGFGEEEEVVTTDAPPVEDLSLAAVEKAVFPAAIDIPPSEWLGSNNIDSGVDEAMVQIPGLEMVNKVFISNNTGLQKVTFSLSKDGVNWPYYNLETGDYKLFEVNKEGIVLLALSTKITEEYFRTMLYKLKRDKKYFIYLDVDDELYKVLEYQDD